MHNCFHVHEPPPPSRPVRPSPPLPTPPPSSSLGAAMKMLLFHHLAGVISVKCLSLGCRLVEGLVRLVGIRSSCLAMFFFHFDWVQSPSRLHLTFQRVQTILPYYYFSFPPHAHLLLFLPVVDCAGFFSWSWRDLCRPVSAWRRFAHQYIFLKKTGMTNLTNFTSYEQYSVRQWVSSELCTLSPSYPGGHVGVWFVTGRLQVLVSTRCPVVFHCYPAVYVGARQLLIGRSHSFFNIENDVFL